MVEENLAKIRAVRITKRAALVEWTVTLHYVSFHHDILNGVFR